MAFEKTGRVQLPVSCFVGYYVGCRLYVGRVQNNMQAVLIIIFPRPVPAYFTGAILIEAFMAAIIITPYRIQVFP